MTLNFSDRDRRQLKVLKERLFLFESESISVQTLVADVDFLIESFESADPEWIASLKYQWGILEEVNAVSIERDLVNLGSELNELVERAVHRLFELVAIAQEGNVE